MQRSAAWVSALILASVLGGLGVWPSVSRAAEVELIAEYKQSNAPLESPEVQVLDPESSDPHLRTWVLERRIALGGFRPKKVGTKWKAELSQIRAVTTAHFRAAGPWYFEVSEFPCGGDPHREAFVTYDGSLFAAERAARAWESVLELAKNQLALRINEVEEDDPQRAVALAQASFQGWLKQLEIEWRTRRLPSVRAEEWKRYEAKAGNCEKGAPRALARTRMERMQVPPREPRTELLTRLPAKLWSGAYTVRVNFLVGGLNLNGRFLLNPALKQSIVNPDFLRGQGINLNLFAKEKTVLIGEFSLGGHKVALNKAIVSSDSARYKPFSSAGECCDGIVGADVLSDYTIEFSPLPEPSVSLYKPLGFSRGALASWIEVSRDSLGKVVSQDCKVEWNFSQIEKPVSEASEPAPLWTGCARERARVFTPSDLSQGTLTLDLPNGRMWLSQSFLSAKTKVNQSGLKVAIAPRSKDDDSRVVKVSSIQAGSPSSRFAEEGLKVGTELLTIDGLDASGMDHWEIEQRLSGRYASQTKLTFKVSRVLRSVTLSHR